MKHPFHTLALYFAACCTPAVVHAQLVQSNFAAGAEGWVSVTLPYPSAVPPTILGTYLPMWVPSLGGYVQIGDPDGSAPTGNVEYWSAPASYLGNMLAAYGGTLQFDLANAGSGFGSFRQEDLLLVGGGLTLVYDLASAPGGSFTHYSVAMSEGGWLLGGLLGPAPTATQFQSVVSALDQLYIRAEFQLGPDTEYLDNVVLTAGPVGVPVTTRPTAFSMSAPIPNPAFTGARMELELPAGADGEIAVFDAAGRRVATLGSGRWPAGHHAVIWDGRDARGRATGAGLYWMRADFGLNHVARALVRLR